RGSQLACAAEDASLTVVDMVDGTLRKRWRSDKGIGNIGSLAWSPDGALLAVGALSGSLIRVFDAATGALRHELSRLPTGATALWSLPESGDLFVCSASGEHMVLSLETTQSHVLTAHRSYVYPAVVSADGSTLLTGGWDGFVGQPGGLKRWDARTGALVAE